MKQTIRAILELARPANIVTAYADILAGFAIAGGSVWLLLDGTALIWPDLLRLLVTTTGLYGGGVILNDYFDSDLDAKERPERPIPSGRISKNGALALGLLFFSVSIAASFQVNLTAFLLTLFILLAAVIYDMKAKHSSFWGPLLMGLCRSGNLLLGVSITPLLLLQWWPLAFIPLIYISAITLISQGEVKGGHRSTGYLALAMVSGLAIGLFFLSFIDAYSFAASILFLSLFAAAVIPSFYRAARDPDSDTIRFAVKRGVLSLVLINSTIAAGFAGFATGLFVGLLLPLSILLGRRFAVT